MKCPNCKKDDELWLILNEEIIHVTCEHSLKTEEMLEYVSMCFESLNS